MDELDSFKVERHTLMNSYGVHLNDVAEPIELRRETLIERETVDEDKKYSPAQSTSSIQDSTDQICQGPFVAKLNLRTNKMGQFPLKFVGQF